MESGELDVSDRGPGRHGAFWKPFDVEPSTGGVHRTVLSLIDAHGCVRTYFLGTPDVLGQPPQALKGQLNGEGLRLLQSRGDCWGGGAGDRSAGQHRWAVIASQRRGRGGAGRHAVEV